MIELRRSVGETPALSRKQRTLALDIRMCCGPRVTGTRVGDKRHNNTDLTSQGGIIYVHILNQRCWDQAGTASENAVFCFYFCSMS